MNNSIDSDNSQVNPSNLSSNIASGSTASATFTVSHTPEEDFDKPSQTVYESIPSSKIPDSKQQGTPETIHEGTKDEDIHEGTKDGDIDTKDEVKLNDKEVIEEKTDEEHDKSNDGSVVEEDDSKLENSSDLTFKKKDVRKPRAHSIQSVLSTASLKSLKQQSIKNPPNFQRNSSNISNDNQNISKNNQNSINGFGSSKNFQSFIQAPVLSSISNLKNNDNIVIGQQLPFNDQSDKSSSDLKLNNEKINLAINEHQDKANQDDQDDQEVLLQQQRLTINALKKLSLSPIPFKNTDDKIEDSSIKINKQQNNPAKKSQPYQPAEVDLSSFASLTRQSNNNIINKNNNTEDANTKNQLSKSISSSTSTSINLALNGLNNSGKSPGSYKSKNSENPSTNKNPSNLPRLPEIDQNQNNISPKNDNIKPIINYHNEVRQNHLSNFKPSTSNKMVPAAVTPPSNMNVRRNVTGMSSIQPSPLPQLPIQQNQQNHFPQLHPHQENNHPSQFTHFPPPAPSTNHPPAPLPAQPNLTSHPNNLHQFNPKDKQVKQLKGFRSPMYVPAVLRMTLNDDLPSPLPINGSNQPNGNPQQLINGGVEMDRHHGISNQSSSKDTSSSRNSIRSFDSNMSNDSSPSSPLISSPISSTGPYTLNKKKYEHILKAAPTRKHWLKDESVIKCQIQGCPKFFNFFERRHHCRKCGGIYCKEHTSHYLYINHLAQFTTGGRGTLSKVCDNCIEAYNDFMRIEFGVDINSTPSLNHSISMHNDDSQTDPDNDLADKLSDLPRGNPPSLHSNGNISPRKNKQPSDYNPDSVDNSKNPNPRSDQLVGSVPANWSWSSF